VKTSKPTKTSENIDTNKSANNSNNTHYIIKINNSQEEPAPDLHNIKRELMRSVFKDHLNITYIKILNFLIKINKRIIKERII